MNHYILAWARSSGLTQRRMRPRYRQGIRSNACFNVDQRSDENIPNLTCMGYLQLDRIPDMQGIPIDADSRGNCSRSDWGESCAGLRGGVVVSCNNTNAPRSPCLPPSAPRHACAYGNRRRCRHACNEQHALPLGACARTVPVPCVCVLGDVHR